MLALSARRARRSPPRDPLDGLLLGLGISLALAMASPTSSEPSTPRLSLPRGAFPDIPGDERSSLGGHSPDSVGTSPASLYGWNLPLQGPDSCSVEQTARDEDAQSVMALAAGRYRPKDWSPDPLPTSPPEGTLSG